jgi:hypothetical protein
VDAADLYPGLKRMRYPIEIEDIEEKRRQEGIEDVELREEIRGLRVGDLVKLTFVAGPGTLETLFVRITSIHGAAFRGRLTAGPTHAGLARLRAGSRVAFTADHIHSLPRNKPPKELGGP